MKISYNWLKQFINVSDNEIETGKLLTELGLEVEGITKFESLKGGLHKVVTGKVVSCKKHPNADRLKVTIVDVGQDDNLQIVCGAPNVDINQIVAVALVGSKLFFNNQEVEIKKSKIRGELSQGMICAEDELGIGASHDGILVFKKQYSPGTPLSNIYNIENDFIFDIGLTPNRADAMSHLGVARDLRVGLIQKGVNLELITPPVDDFNINNRSVKLNIKVADAKKTPRYCGLVIKDLTVGESPEWLKNKLNAIGLTPINNIVDITNYVMHDLGQPLHAFDFEKIINNNIEVKSLKKGTKFTTLDGVERILSDNDLMICSDNIPLCMAGLYGGLNSGVKSTTTSIFLESAYFDPITIRKTAKNHGLKTDASYRFERGIDPNITKYALKRAAILITELCGGNISSEIEDLYPEKFEDFEVLLNYNQVDKLIGQKIEHETIKNILTSLDIKINSITETRLGLSIPYYRNDVTREADVIEEILRVYGYNNITSNHKLNSSISDIEIFSDHNLQNSISDLLVSLGFYEIMTNSLTKPMHTKISFDENDENDVNIMNSLSNDLSIMRQNILFSQLEVASYNINRKQLNLKLFEFGKTYRSFENKNIEQKKLSILITGDKTKKSWNNANKEVDFYFCKGLATSILNKLGLTNTHSKNSSKNNISQGLSHFLGKTEIVTYGEVHKDILKYFDIDQKVYYLEFNWDIISTMINNKSNLIEDISKFPIVSRDLSFLVDKSLSFQEIKKACKKINIKLIKRVDLFDVYEGEKIPKEKKSYGLNFTISSNERTLSEEEIENLMNKIIKSLTNTFNAELRN